MLMGSTDPPVGAVVQGFRLLLIVLASSVGTVAGVNMPGLEVKQAAHEINSMPCHLD